ncbi:MAG TPA: hypothetical protein VM370_01805 [Candidatus Thermoplasmatota archaeon]|nr:hypothetical protein [Candidatus Thermoplasmatota archaeon]
MRGYAASLLAAFLLLPLVAAAPLVQQGTTPALGVPQAPQLYCVIHYEVAGAQRCDVFGAARDVGEVRILIEGAAGGNAYFLLDDVSKTPTQQVAFGTCPNQCRFTFPPATSPRLALYLYTSGGARTTIVGELATAPETLL